MNIGIDLDDTLSTLQALKLKTANEYFKKYNISYNLINKNANRFGEMYDWTGEECSKFWREIADTMLSKAKPKASAVNVVNNLKNSGHKIIIISARTNQWHDDPYALTFNWLTKNNIPFDKIIVGHLDKTNSCIEEKIDIFIDDIPETLVKLQSVNIDTILMSTYHNKTQSVYSGKSFSSWKQIEKYINSKN